MTKLLGSVVQRRLVLVNLLIYRPLPDDISLASTLLSLILGIALEVKGIGGKVHLHPFTPSSTVFVLSCLLSEWQKRSH